MKRFFFIAVILLTWGSLSGQNVIITIVGDDSEIIPVKNKVLDHAYIECIYDSRSARDTVNIEAVFREDVMKLLIGPEITKYYSFKTEKGDSLMRPDLHVMFSSSDDASTLYKDNAGKKIILTDNIAGIWFRYEEAFEGQQWEISDETKEVLGYECQKAECDFRGRNYTAWFTPEIPVSDGPWKFSGLPGLILEISDAQGHYSFMASGIRQTDSLPITYPERQYQKTTRKEYLRTLRRFISDPVTYMKADSEIKFGFGTVDGMSIPEDVFTMKYDFLEKDYK